MNNRHIPISLKKIIFSFSAELEVNALLSANKEFNRIYVGSPLIQFRHLTWQYTLDKNQFRNKTSQRLQEEIEDLENEIKEFKNPNLTVKKMFYGSSIMAMVGTFEGAMTCCLQCFPCCWNCMCTSGVCKPPACAIANVGGCFACTFGSGMCEPFSPGDPCCYPFATACLPAYSLCACAACICSIGLCYQGYRKYYSSLNPEQRLEYKISELKNWPEKYEMIRNHLQIKLNFFKDAETHPEYKSTVMKIQHKTKV